MSSGEILLTLVVALIVFGPSKLPMLATHLGRLVAKFNCFKSQLASIWQTNLAQAQLQENQLKAQEADELYKQTIASTQISSLDDGNRAI